MRRLPSFVRRIVRYLELVRFSHTLFALPFGLIALLVAAGGLPKPAQLAWILVAMVGARTAAMTFNRIVDAELDRRNPRTAERHIPAGTVSRREAWCLFVLACSAFLTAAAMLSWLCLVLAPLALGILLGYSYTKRFTCLSHFVLGAALGCAPLGVYVALQGGAPAEAWLLALAVLLWVAGFDVLYATQDEAFDRAAGLHSLVVRLGLRRALWISRGLHAAAACGFAFYGLLAELHGWYAVGVGIVATALAYEHTLVSADDLSRVNVAFFTVNGLVSLVLLLFTALDVFL